MFTPLGRYETVTFRQSRTRGRGTVSGRPASCALCHHPVTASRGWGECNTPCQVVLSSYLLGSLLLLVVVLPC